MSSTQSFFRHASSPPRVGFTLVELLIVIVMIALVSGMAATSYQGVSQASRAARTRAIIATINSVLQEKYESYKHRPLAVEIPDMFTPLTGSGELGLEVLAMESARVRLAMVRDLQRMEMPDRFSDFTNQTNPSNPSGGRASLHAAVNPVRLDGNGNLSRVDRGSRRVLPVNWFNSSVLDNYRGRLTANADVTNQGAECLYLIMSSNFIGGAPAIDGIPASNIGDTDGDGMAEILDGWGRPFVFIRWPVGYIDPNGGIDRAMPDDFDPLRVDYAYAEYPDQQNPDQMIAPASAQVFNPDPNSSVTHVKPFSMRPLVVSAGSDGEFGIETNPGSQVDFSYTHISSLSWATDRDHYGDEWLGRTAAASYNFPDPYLRNYTNASMPNGVLPGQTTIAEDRADNITNFDPQE